MKTEPNDEALMRTQAANNQPQTPTQTDWDLGDKYLRLKKKSIRKLITLPPKYLGNINKAIEETIFKSNQEIFNEFNGVPITMGKKILLQNVGTSIDDHPYIQFYVDLECVVFSPKIDKKVKAVVNKIGETYVGCLICGKINATIFKKNKKSKDESQSHQEPHSANQIVNRLKIGDTVLLKIKSIQYEQNNLFIVGTFDSLLQ